MRPTKDLIMMAHAVLVSRMSSCARLQVGCVLTDQRFEQIASGYNGAYRGGPNQCLHPGAQGGCGCVHAETNAVIKARFVPYHAFVTDSPCEMCASALVNAGVRRVVYAREYRVTDGVTVLLDAGVEVKGLEPLELSLELEQRLGLRVREAPYGWRLPNVVP